VTSSQPTPAQNSNDDGAIEAPLAQLHAAGVRTVPWAFGNGHYVRVPLADGSEITFTGSITDRDENRAHEASTWHPVSAHGGWQASVNDGRRSVDLYDSFGQHLPFEEDTAALVAAVLTCTHQHFGCAPVETAAQLATRALAERGVTAHSIGGDAGIRWLSIWQDQHAGGSPAQGHPHLRLSLYNLVADDYVADLNRPLDVWDNWHLSAVDATGTAQVKAIRSGCDLIDLAEYIVNWATPAQG
jgi:hypothetical protein